MTACAPRAIYNKHGAPDFAVLRLEDNYLEVQAGSLTGELLIMATPNCAVLPAGSPCAVNDGAEHKNGRRWKGLQKCALSSSAGCCGVR